MTRTFADQCGAQRKRILRDYVTGEAPVTA